MGRIRSYISRHATAVFAVLAMACFFLQLMATEYQIGRSNNNQWLSDLTPELLIQLVVNHLGDALLLAMPFYLLSRRWRRLGWLVVLAVTIWCFAQFIYYPIYRDLMPFSSFFLFGNVTGVVVNSTVGALRWGHLEVVLPPLLLLASYLIWFRRRIENVDTTPLRRRLLIACASVVTFGIMQLCVTAYQYHADDEADSGFGDFLYTQYAVVWSRHSYYFTYNGFVPLVAHSAVTSIIDDSELSDRQQAELDTYLGAMPQYTDNTYAFHPAACGRPNLILLVVESLNSWGVTMDIDGRKVAPTLDSLSRDANAIVGLKMKSQVKNGRSSDGIFIYNTGLLPLMTKPVAMSYSDASYPALPHALNGYSSLYLCCDDPYLWNKSRMAQQYGYTRFVSANDRREQLSKHYDRIDSILLDAAIGEVKQLPQPFAAMITTTGMHTPYEQAVVPPTFISASKRYTPQVRNYLERLSFFDKQLAIFLNRLKSEGLYDNTLIVIVSDHNEFIDTTPQGRPAIDAEGDNCTMIILNSGQKGRRIESVFGQIDVYPTLLDLMGANHYEWKGLGNSLLRTQVSSAAISPDETAGTSPQLPRQRQAWQIAHLLIVSRHFTDKD